jgi:hypothetical protein
LTRELLDQLNQSIGRPALSKPESETLDGNWSLGAGHVGLDQPLQHGPVLFPLRLLNLNEILKRHDRDGPHARHLPARSAFPECLKRIGVPHHRHYIQSNLHQAGRVASEMTGVAPFQNGFGEGREEDRPRVAHPAQIGTSLDMRPDRPKVNQALQGAGIPSLLRDTE